MDANRNGADGVIVSSTVGDVRATQSFVRVMSDCWKRPSLTALEVLWRWMYGIPTLWLLWRVSSRTVQAAQLNMAELKAMTVTQPVNAASTLAEAMSELLPGLLADAKWMVPLLLAIWVVWSSLGRTVVLRRMEPKLHARPLTLMALQTMRVATLAVMFGIWAFCVRWAGRLTVTGPITQGVEPNLVGYSALVILATIVMFVVWATVSWGFSVGPLLAMMRNQGTLESLKGAFRLRSLKAKLIEVNLVMGIVKIALVVLALVISSTPLPFESIASPRFLAVWWEGAAVVYLIATDFFQVSRIMAYLRLWQAYEDPEQAVEPAG